MILWTNGIFHSLIDEDHVYHQVITDQGYIVGFDDEAKDLSFDQIIDLKGAHVYPGFVDSHIHLMGYGQHLTRPSLKGMTKKDDILKIIQSHETAIIFEGFHSDQVTKEDLDQWIYRPIVLRHADYHAATLNTFALKQLGLSNHDGVVKEADALRAMSLFGNTNQAKMEVMFKKALKQLYQYGVTGGHSDDLAYFSGYKDTLNAMSNVLKEMPFRAHLLMHHTILDEYLASGLTWLDQTPYLQLGAIKMFYDGSFGSKTALVSQPYEDDTYGLRILDQTTLHALVKKVRALGLPLAIHVIGDQGLSEVFDLLTTYPVKKGLHDRIIHASSWQEKDFERAKKLPLIFDIQPQFVSSDIPDMLSVFKKEPKHLYPWRSMLTRHLVICGGSDAPVERPHPLEGMYAAIYRETSIGPYKKDECLTRYEALKLYTTWSNIPTYQTNRGLLKKGYIADFTMIKHDILKVPKASFKDNQILMTVINEHIVYQG